MMRTRGYAAYEVGGELEPYFFDRRDPRPEDVAMEVLYSGVCHSDLHQVRNDWGGSSYPMVPGHEIVGRVTAVGSAVIKYKVGDHVAVGCFVDSCLECDQCRKGEEVFCREVATQTYNTPDRLTGAITLGGYAKHLVVRQEFVLRIPDSLDISRAAPLLCAGITTYVPLKIWNAGKGTRVGVVGLGGLGHMAVKLAVGLGAEVTVISRSYAKKADALALGAKHLLVSTDSDAMAAAAASFDLIIDTVPAKHDINPYIALLDIDGTLDIVGQLGFVPEVQTVPMVMGRRRIAGSPVGGIARTQEMLDFCGEKGILPDVEIIRMDEINTAFERLEKADVRYRFVIDMSSI